MPSARACTYVLPASDYALALTVAAAAATTGSSDMKAALKLGVTEKEIDALCSAVLQALKTGPAEPDAIRDAVGSKARSLGPEGQKKGISSTLPLALGRLQLTGDIRRMPTNGRLDQQRYRYTLWNPNPLEGFKLTPEEAHVALARLYFQWIGPASQAEFQWFSGLGVKASKDALSPLGLVPLEEGSDRLLLPQDLEALHAFRLPKDPIYRLTSSLDSLVLLRRDHRSLSEAADLDSLPVLTREVWPQVDSPIYPATRSSTGGGSSVFGNMISLLNQSHGSVSSNGTVIWTLRLRLRRLRSLAAR